MTINFGFGCSLEPISEDALSTLQGFRNQFAIRRWCRQNDLLSQIDQKNWFQKINSDNSIKMYAVSVGSDPLVGIVGLTSIDSYNRVAEFSIYIDPKKHRLGHGNRALKTLMCHGFGNLNLNRIFGESFVGNPGSKLYGKLGFTNEGIQRETYFKSGKMINSEIWSLIFSDVQNLAWVRLIEEI